MNSSTAYSDDDIEIIPSELDERTHAELLMMYNEAALSIRFQKNSQWKALFFGLLLQFIILAFGEYSPYKMHGLAELLIICSTVTTAIFVYAILVYHLLQNLEREKLLKITKNFSSIFREVRGISSPIETAFHRYTLMLIMMSILISNCAIVVSLLGLYAI